ncbi:MAG: glycosyltransferase family 2 protein [Proteobacteria bacterium]|nr:MAG: glycosyltransferase family 2 protein [Pseudomonadota bacterium]
MNSIPDYCKALADSKLASEKRRFVGVSVVKNESDVIEYFVRCNLRYLDAMVVIDNGSVDETRRILAALSREPLPLVVLDDDRVGHFQGRRLTGLARACAQALGAGYVVPLDADEFICAPGRDAYRDLVEYASHDTVPMVFWRTFVPTPDDDAADPNPLRRITHRRVHEREDIGKVVIPASVLEDESVVLLEGSHGLVSDRGDLLHATFDGVRLAHFPIRSAAQFVSKALIGQLSIHLNPDRVSGSAFHWKAMFEHVVDSWDVSPEALREFGCIYSDHHASGLVFDPLDASFAPACRYPQLAEPDVHARVAGFLRAMLSQHPVYPVARTRGLLERLQTATTRTEGKAVVKDVFDDVVRYCQSVDHSEGNRDRRRIRRVHLPPFEPCTETAARREAVGG